MLGVDGCRGGWIGAEVSADATGEFVRRKPTACADGPTTTDRSRVQWLRFADASQIASIANGYDAIGIDMPIGLPDTGARACDVEARQLLGSRWPCVFHAPVRAALSATTYAEACDLSRAVSGRALSQQTWHITKRISEVDGHLAGLAHVVEVHPEVSFAALAGSPLPPKRTPVGRDARLTALRRWIPHFDLPPTARIDALDALAVAWSATRWLHGTATTIPDEPPTDSRGRPMRIVF